MVADLWKRENQSKNAEKIAARGAELYDKFVLFAEALNDVGTSIDNARKSHELAMNRLKEGRGNLVGQAEKLRELGVKSKKNIPSNLIEE